MAKRETRTESGGASKLYGTLPAIQYDVVTLEKTDAERLGEALEVVGGNPALLADLAISAFNNSQRESAGGAFWKLLKHARALIKGGAVPGISLETVKNDKNEDVVSPKTAAVIQALATSMQTQIAATVASQMK